MTAPAITGAPLSPPSSWRKDVALAPFTTFRTGGTADWFVEPASVADLQQSLRFARAHGLPVTVLGGGSNVLVSDRGVRGVVIRPRLTAISATDAHHVQAGAGVTINGLVRWTIARGLAALEAWAGTPGTVGGAIHGNAHFQGRLIGELVTTVRLLSPSGEIADVPSSQLELGYDRSRLSRTREIVVSADFSVTPGEPAALRRVARESLAFRKRTQPLQRPSAGCIFQNPSAGDPVPAGIPRSAGALVDRAGLKGATVGGATVSPVHANFIVNDGHASASDIRALVYRCRSEVAARFGVTLREEIVYLGDFVDP
ncbi:MAG: UDP-N-acetylmuramate dehydrogenase [Vicinamibacterales bacterium]